ncbi:hypothetical protein CEXT_486221 [Caerostris extrusa]|uniref:Uncharacterized protein n=1 Tax=Caerostris extrusa TaxID=172846 RepID=A0AAV4N3D4_CAEEX|nr:hypothetical protein CEXT_486221 [Caerostris extrusa]
MLVAILEKEKDTTKLTWQGDLREVIAMEVIKQHPLVNAMIKIPAQVKNICHVYRMKSKDVHKGTVGGYF